MSVQSKWQQLPTEAINPSTLGIDKLSPAGIIDLMLDEDRKIMAAVARERDHIALGVELISEALRRGGRLVFIGAGTSGRLGVLEAAEIPPNFGTSPSLVRAVMAGGTRALVRAREGVEDNYEQGSRAMARLRPSAKDVVVGVSASGMTQFVRGGLNRARRVGARIIFVTCYPGTELQTFVDLTIAPSVGPEVICRVDAPQGGHGHQDRAEHAHDRVDGARWQDLRQPDGRRADRFGEAEGPRAPDPDDGQRHRVRRGQHVAQARALERSRPRS